MLFGVCQPRKTVPLRPADSSEQIIDLVTGRKGISLLCPAGALQAANYRSAFHSAVTALSKSGLLVNMPLTPASSNARIYSG